MTLIDINIEFQNLATTVRGAERFESGKSDHQRSTKVRRRSYILMNKKQDKSVKYLAKMKYTTI